MPTYFLKCPQLQRNGSFMITFTPNSMFVIEFTSLQPPKNPKKQSKPSFVIPASFFASGGFSPLALHNLDQTFKIIYLFKTPTIEETAAQRKQLFIIYFPLHCQSHVQSHKSRLSRISSDIMSSVSLLKLIVFIRLTSDDPEWMWP